MFISLRKRKLKRFFENSDVRLFFKTSPIDNPSRPGKIIKDLLLEVEISVTAMSGHLGVTRQALNNLINNENASISPEMAIRLEVVVGLSADCWLRMQANYDVFKVRLYENEIKQNLKPIFAL